MDEKKLHTREFQQKGSGRNMRCKLLQKRLAGKTTESSKHLRHIAIEKDILSELNRCIFQISLKYIKLFIPKILFILVLCSFNFYFKITWTPPSPKLEGCACPDNSGNIQVLKRLTYSRSMLNVPFLYPLQTFSGDVEMEHCATID